MMVPILTESQFLAVRGNSAGYVVDVVPRGPCTIHRAGCDAVGAEVFRARVIVNRGRIGTFLFGASFGDACAEAGPDAHMCTKCSPGV